MSYVIRVYGTRRPANFDGQYVEMYSPEAFNGRGDLTSTDDVKLAQRFATQKEALDFAMRSPLNLPKRADGKPNRPLTAFTIKIEEVVDALQ